MTDRPKVLILTPEFPYPPNDGLRLRMSQAIHSLSIIGDITLISFTDVNADHPEFLPSEKLQALMGVDSIVRVEKPRHTTLKRLIESILLFQTAAERTYESREFSKILEQTLSCNQFDYCLILGASRLLNYLSKLKGLRVGVDLCDNILAVYSNRASITKPIFGQLYFKIQGYISRFSLKRGLRFVDEFIFISNKDTNCMAKVGCNKWRVIPNYVDDEYFLTDLNSNRPKNKLLFVGSMTSKENIDAVYYFCDKILPIIHRQRPDTIFRVVGKEGESLSLSKDYKRVETEGFVSNLSSEYSSCTIFVCPLRSGSGVKNKMLQAMASGCAIVTTSFGAEGIGSTHGEEIFIADSPDLFAHGILSLFENPSVRESLGKKARLFSMRWFSRKSIADNWYRLVLSQAR